jgi:hypothetical protein
MYTKTVLVRKEISKDEAKAKLTEARVVGMEIDVYQNIGGTLFRVFTIPAPAFFDLDPNLLLEYARNHIPDEINF